MHAHAVVAALTSSRVERAVASSRSHGVPSTATLSIAAARPAVFQQGELPTGVTRGMGVDAGSGITWVFLSLAGKRVDAGSPAASPRLTAQCTRTAAGKLKFELLADLGDVPSIAFYPPWKPTSTEQFPPRLDKAQVTMEFLGYTRVKPLKRQWEYMDHIPSELRYATPGLGSANMEPLGFYLQYLRSLPTLRLTVPGKGAAEWDTMKWQQVLYAEPLCAAYAK